MLRQRSLRSGLGLPQAGFGFAFASPFLLGIAALLASCYEGRFPVCRSNAECEGRDAGKLGNICFDLRCVECRYDIDCPTGQVCGATQSCSTISGTPAASASEAAPTWEAAPGASAPSAASKKRPPKGANKAPPPR
jgi:Cys-rich repeat protein